MDVDSGPNRRTSTRALASPLSGSASTPTTASRRFRSASQAEAARTSNACQICRDKKVKCSGQQPCKYCAKRGLDCVFAASEKRKLYSISYVLPCVHRRRLLSTSKQDFEMAENDLTWIDRLGSSRTKSPIMSDEEERGRHPEPLPRCRQLQHHHRRHPRCSCTMLKILQTKLQLCMVMTIQMVTAHLNQSPHLVSLGRRCLSQYYPPRSRGRELPTPRSNAHPHLLVQEEVNALLYVVWQATPRVSDTNPGE